ncbi:MAG: flagellar motor protein MotA [Dongiaceae bacterium]
MTRPGRYLAWMAAGIVAVLVLAAAMYDRIIQAFSYNPGLNGGIFIVLLIGICFAFWQVIRLYREIDWLDKFRSGAPDITEHGPRLLAPMAAMIGERRGRFSLSALSLRSLLDGLQARLMESHELSRYFIGLLVFLGLLGTFWGLLGTINGVTNAITGMTVGSGDIATTFDQLKSSLQQPLTGMGTAFSSSLFGLAGSLIVGFLELQAGQAQNRFFNEVEDWLSGQTRLGSGGPVTDGEQSVPVYIQALLEQTAESLDNLQRTMSHAEEGRVQASQRTHTMVERLTLLTDQMRAEQQLLVKVAESQNALQIVLQRMNDSIGTGTQGIDEASRQHLRNLDIQMNRLVDETVTGRQYMVHELRSEIKLLTRTIAAIAEGETPQVR